MLCSVSCLLQYRRESASLELGRKTRIFTEFFLLLDVDLNAASQNWPVITHECTQKFNSTVVPLHKDV